MLKYAQLQLEYSMHLCGVVDASVPRTLHSSARAGIILWLCHKEVKEIVLGLYYIISHGDC